MESVAAAPRIQIAAKTIKKRLIYPASSIARLSIVQGQDQGQANTERKIMVFVCGWVKFLPALA